MISLVTLLSLDAHAITFTVNGGGSLQNALTSACITGGQSHIINIDTTPRDTYFLGPGSIDGDVVTYPPVGCGANETNPPDIIIQTSPNNGGTATLKYQLQAAPTAATLMTFRNGANVTIRNLNIEGTRLLDYSGQVEDLTSEAPLGPECALGGAFVRGIQISGLPGANNTGSLTLDGVDMRCLDGDDEQSGEAGLNPQNGGAVLSNGVPVSIVDSYFYANSAITGGAIAILSGNTEFDPVGEALTIENSVFQNNGSLFGGAVFFDWPGRSADIDFATFQGNVGRFGTGGIDFRDMTNVAIRRTVFDRQNFQGYSFEQLGGAVRLGQIDSVDFHNNLVCGSWSAQGGGIYAQDVADFDIEGNVFAENGALFYGGGLSVGRSQLATGETAARVVNNTFIGNEAGRTPPYLNEIEIFALGGGGAAAFFGVNPEFRNNMVAFAPFGGGVFGDYIPFTQPPGFQIGDSLGFYHNLFYLNTDEVNGDDVHVTGEFASIAFHPSNLQGVDPLLTYTALEDFNCVPDAFFPLRDSPLIDAGGGPAEDGVPSSCSDFVDTDGVPDFVHDTELDGPCDIGAFGGDMGLFARDADGDGVQNIFDCDDNNNQVMPGTVETTCDFIDDNCDGVVDEGFENQWWPDLDGDGFGDANGVKILDCTPVPNYVSNGDDCDDTNGDVFEGAPEICDGIDNNCEGEIDEGLVYTTYFEDFDGDGYGTGEGVPACNTPPNSVVLGGDCNDGDLTISPDAIEFCGDDVDNDCDGLQDAQDDSAAPVTSFFVDADGDGFGNDESVTRVCGEGATIPEGFSSRGQDCNDSDSSISPGGSESCSIGGDEDCDGLVDEIDSNTIDATPYYPDSDADGLGSDINPTYVCDGQFPPSGFVDVAGDCDDSDPLVSKCPQACGCQATSNSMGLLGLFAGLAGVLARRRR